MRSIAYLVMLVGCAPLHQESRGVTLAEYAGTAPLVFTNATPEPMCGLYLSYDGKAQFGDNWLPRGGLASGKSIELRVRPGTYQATWNTCKRAKQPYFAGTLIADTAFAVDEPTQLYAYIADHVSPTKRAMPRDFHKLVRFSGQEILPYGVRVTQIARVEPVREAPPAPRVDLSAFIDQKAVRQLKIVTAKSKAKQRPRHKASLKRVHDVANARAGYVQR